ncbi:MAG: hypothetical protein APR54_01585 [Candidatus Cloacimonas sp. SDB]|nr:MAG: hypothetical protein APR54_01585 [Candidatus Cloacimonas sp. SDB]
MTELYSIGIFCKNSEENMDKILNLNGTIKLEGSKSILNRILILSTFMTKPLKLENFSSSEDIITLVQNLRRLGMKIIQENNTITIGIPEKFQDGQTYFIKNSGTALRFLLTRLAFIPGLDSVVDASEQLRSRPVKPLVNILKNSGVQFKNDKLPLSFRGINFRGGNYNVSVSISSQFVSSLLLCSSQLEQDLIIHYSGTPVSVSYIDLTRDILQDFGIKVEKQNNSYRVQRGQKITIPDEYRIEPDLSSAAYFFALGAVNEGEVKVQVPDRSKQPDHKFLKILEEMGAKIEYDGNLVTVKKDRLTGIKADMNTMPDQVPTLACLALLADSPTEIYGIDQLQYKESDRLMALLQELPKLGSSLRYEGNRLHVTPLRSEPTECRLETHHDHRLIMSFSLLKQVFPQINLSGRKAVLKSFPHFFKLLASLRDNA